MCCCFLFLFFCFVLKVGPSDEDKKLSALIESVQKADLEDARFADADNWIELNRQREEEVWREREREKEKLSSSFYDDGRGEAKAQCIHSDRQTGTGRQAGRQTYRQFKRRFSLKIIIIIIVNNICSLRDVKITSSFSSFCFLIFFLLLLFVFKKRQTQEQTNKVCWSLMNEWNNHLLPSSFVM